MITEAVKEEKKKKALVRRGHCTVLLCLVDKVHKAIAIVCRKFKSVELSLAALRLHKAKFSNAFLHEVHYWGPMLWCFDDPSSLMMLSNFKRYC